MSIPEKFQAFRISAEKNQHLAEVVALSLDDINHGELTIEVAYSSVNYKDALAGTGAGKILRKSPLIGGIDVAGTVVESRDNNFREGDKVLVTGCGLSETRDGGYSEYARLESKWAIPLPSGLTLKESMIIGTAGFTAALSLFRMEANGQTPQAGSIVVTGATGGVGQLSIDILTTAGYEVHAISGKADQFDHLINLGATQCISRHGLYWGQRPLEPARWAGAIDSVGGEMLAGLSRVISPYGNIASCGLVADSELHTTVMPFIIRGVSILGIASAGTAYSTRRILWERLASDWKPTHLSTILNREVTLAELPATFAKMMLGESLGRTLLSFKKDH